MTRSKILAAMQYVTQGQNRCENRPQHTDSQMVAAGSATGGVRGAGRGGQGHTGAEKYGLAYPLAPRLEALSGLTFFADTVST